MSFSITQQDINGLSQAELDDVIRHQQILYDSIPIPASLWTEDGQVVDCNDAMVKFFKCESKKECLEHFFSFSTEYQHDGNHSADEAARLQNQTWEEGYARCTWTHLVEGEIVPVELICVRISYKGKKLLAAYAQDLRPIKHAIDARHEADDRANLLLNSMPLAVLMLNDKFECIECNRAAVELFCREPGEPFSYKKPGVEEPITCRRECSVCDVRYYEKCVARPYLIANSRRIFDGYDSDRETVDRIIKETCEQALNEGVHRREYVHVTLYGAPIPCEVMILSMKYKGSHAFTCCIRDLRESMRMEAEKIRREAAEEESRAKTRFLARMSHEIRTPMNVVLGITEMQMRKEGHTAETEEAFSRIYSSSNLLLSIINDILDLSKVEAGRMDIVPLPYETASLIVDTVQLNLMYIGSKRINFKINVCENLPAFLVGDELRIKQILNNILSNAFKYTSEGSVGFNVGMENGEGDELELIMQITDTGQGMTKEQIDHLFEIEFTRFNVQYNRAIEGSGLGMNIAYQLTQMMNGAINVESEPGVGTTITLRIPQRRENTEILGSDTVKNLQNLETTQRALKRFSRFDYTPMPYGRVLVVDDVESNLYVAKGLMLPYKLSIETAGSGYEAISKIEAGNVYDIIFMDHMMPGMDGMEATKTLRALGYTNPIVALTANTVLGQSELFLNNGFTGFISKPVDVYQLNTYLIRYVRDKQPLDVVDAVEREHAAKLEESAILKAGGTEGVSFRLKESFLRDAARSIDALGSALQQKFFDADAFKIFVIHTHAMKSALYNINENVLSQVAGALEMAAHDNDMATINALSGGFLARLEEVSHSVSADILKSAVIDVKPAPDAEEDEEDESDAIIFVVDDSDTNLILADEALGELYTVYTIISAQQMFKMLKKFTPDLILLDIEMPEIDGFETMETLKATPEHNKIPVVFITATVTEQVTEKAKQLGSLEVMSKPFTPEGLQSNVRRWLTHTTSAREEN